MASAHIDLGIDAVEEPPRVVRRREGEVVLTRRYQAKETCPTNREPLHDLLQKQPAVLGSLQMVSGLLSVGLGIILAVSQDMEQSLLSLFRVSHMTGALFIFAGVVSNMLFTYPELLSASLMINAGCLCVAFAGAPLIIVDLTKGNLLNPELQKMEMIELCILGLESSLSVVLCIWFAIEKRKPSK